MVLIACFALLSVEKSLQVLLINVIQVAVIYDLVRCILAESLRCL